jgi:hypothetical protein
MWICVKESVVVLTPYKVALRGEGPVRETIYFSCTLFYPMAGGLFFEVLDWFGGYSNLAYVKPFPGVNPVIGKILVPAFLLTMIFTWPGIELPA